MYRKQALGTPESSHSELIQYNTPTFSFSPLSHCPTHKTWAHGPLNTQRWALIQRWTPNTEMGIYTEMGNYTDMGSYTRRGTYTEVGTYSEMGTYTEVGT